MKEKTACVLGIMFGAAIIAFTAMRIIPVEVFCSMAAGVIVWFFKEKEKEKLLKLMEDIKGIKK